MQPGRRRLPGRIALLPRLSTPFQFSPHCRASPIESLPDNAPDRVGRSHGNRFCQERTSPWIRLRVKNALLPAILTVRRHRLPVTTCKRAIVVRDIADTPIDISEGCTLFPTAGNTADGGQGTVFHSYVGAACTIGSLRHRLGMGGLEEHRAGDQERCKRAERDFHLC